VRAAALAALVAQGAVAQGLTLEAATAKALEQVPALRAARAQEAAASARARAAFAPLLPQVSLGLSYSRATANFVGRPGQVPNTIAGAQPLSLDSFDFFTGNVSAQVLVWDFLSTWNRHQAAKAQAEGQAAQTRALEVTTVLAVRTAYFAARAQDELVQVAQASLDNTKAHLAQISAFVAAGARPDIDLAQARLEVANAKLALVSARSAAALARARLGQAMGVPGPLTGPLVDAALPATPTEDEALEALAPRAVAARPEARQLDAQVRASERALAAAKGTFWPTVTAQLSGNAQARTLANVVPNVSGQLALSWPLYQGGLTDAQVAEAEAALVAARAQVEVLASQVRLDVEQARLDVQASREAVEGAHEARAAAAERLRLAEGRYAAGAGSVIELSDAQVAFTRAGAQVAQETFTLSAARARLAAAMGD
jgi:outer membrane protein